MQLCFDLLVALGQLRANEVERVQRLLSANKCSARQFPCRLLAMSSTLARMRTFFIAPST